jgi:hypothetical protein
MHSPPNPRFLWHIAPGSKTRNRCLYYPPDARGITYAGPFLPPNAVSAAHSANPAIIDFFIFASSSLFCVCWMQSYAAVSRRRLSMGLHYWPCRLLRLGRASINGNDATVLTANLKF